jgi:hypothetical protein
VKGDGRPGDLESRDRVFGPSGVPGEGEAEPRSLLPQMAWKHWRAGPVYRLGPSKAVDAPPVGREYRCFPTSMGLTAGRLRRLLPPRSSVSEPFPISSMFRIHRAQRSASARSADPVPTQTQLAPLTSSSLPSGGRHRLSEYPNRRNDELRNRPWCRL